MGEPGERPGEGGGSRPVDGRRSSRYVGAMAALPPFAVVPHLAAGARRVVASARGLAAGARGAAASACLVAGATFLATGGTIAAGAEASGAETAQRFDAERCPLPLQLRALGSVGSAAGSWKALHVHFQTYGPCDAGPVREGYAHGVVSLLASRWELLPDLARHAKDDPAFLDFVVAHLDATSAPEDLEIVRRSAKEVCPRAHRALCRRLEAQADAVLHSREVAREGQ